MTVQMLQFFVTVTPDGEAGGQSRWKGRVCRIKDRFTGNCKERDKRPKADCVCDAASRKEKVNL